jgi:hypothetical protein
MGSEAVGILICGDTGPARSVLLARSEIKLYWAASLKDARAALRTIKPKLLIVRPKLRDGELIELLPLPPQVGPVPVLMLLKGPEWETRGKYLEGGVTELIEHHDGDRLLDEISRLTGLKFSKHRRVALDVGGEVRVPSANKTFLIRTRDLSLTGLAVKGMTPLPFDTPVKMTLIIDGAPIGLWGRVQRCWKDGGDLLTGLRFIALRDDERLQIAAMVDQQAAEGPPVRPSLGPLFDDIELPDDDSQPLRTADLLPTSSLIRPPTVVAKATPDGPAAQLIDRIRAHKPALPRSAVAAQAREALRELEDAMNQEDDAALVELASARAAILREYLVE